MSSFDKDGQLSITQGPIIDCIGRKGSGKSVLALILARSFPFDLIAIDPAGDDGPRGGDVIEWRGTVDTLPGKFPEFSRKSKDQRLIVRYVPDMGSATALEDMDAVVGMALEHSTKQRPAMLLVHEAGLVFPAGRTPPHCRRALNANRHRGLVMVLCMPRPKTVNPLVIAQADALYVFELKNPDDRKVIAAETGCDGRTLNEGLDNLRPHGYLRYDARWSEADAVDEPTPWVDYPGLPVEDVHAVEEWAHGDADRVDELTGIRR